MCVGFLGWVVYLLFVVLGLGIGVIFMWWLCVWFFLLVLELIGCLLLNVVVNMVLVGMLLVIRVWVMVSECCVDSF